MREIVDVAHARGTCVIEDACQSPGATVDGRIAGAWGDIAVLSFGGSKLLTAGRGGAVLTNNASYHQRAKIYSERGNQAFPLSELQAAVILPQLGQLAELNHRRQLAAAHLRAALTACPYLRPTAASTRDDRPSYYKLSWFYDQPAASPITRTQLIDAARAEGIAIDSGFRGFAGRSSQRCRRIGTLDHACRAAAQTVLLHHPVLLADLANLDRLARTLATLVAALENAS